MLCFSKLNSLGVECADNALVIALAALRNEKHAACGAKRVKGVKRATKKDLCWFLRHCGPNGRMPSDAFVWVSDIVKHKSLAWLINVITEASVKHLADHDPDDRYELFWRKSKLFIRCRQGHGLKKGVDPAKLFEPVDNATGLLCYHRTTFAGLNGIEEAGGILRMRRSFVHTSPCDADGVPIDSHGSRKDLPVLIRIDLKRFVSDGGITWRTSTGNYMLDGPVRCTYFLDIECSV
jgi:RNA:NAD 2'-phosphotransferase (TPT1/KptA family)